MNHLVKKNKNIEGAFDWSDLNPFRLVKEVWRQVETVAGWGEDIGHFVKDNMYHPTANMRISDKERASIEARLHIPKVDAPVLRPPIIGVDLASSYSFVEIIDCLSDGPIAGLVCQDINGIKITNNDDRLTAIYIDDQPVSVNQ